MTSNTWKKRENEAGFPYYLCDNSNVRQWDHPAYADVISKVSLAADVKYAVYRMAYKLIYLQEQLKVPDISLINGVFAHHCLSISESTFVLEPCEMEAILTDIYFAASKKGLFDGNVDLATELTLNYLLNVYDRERTSSINVQSAKTGLALICSSSVSEVWGYLFSSISDHNGCVRPRRLAFLLAQVGAVAEYLGEGTTYGRHAVQPEVDKCFAKTPGMLGLSEQGLMQWLESGPSLLNWIQVKERIRLMRSTPTIITATQWKCALCSTKNPQGLKFKCTRCWGMMVCEKCYLYSDNRPPPSSIIHRHNKSHVVKEIIDAQAMPSKCMIGLIKSVKKVLSCPPGNCRRSNQTSHNVQFPLQNGCAGGAKAEAVVKGAGVVTSTVGKAQGKRVTDPRTILQDIITHLEQQNKALKSLSYEVQQNGSLDKRLQHQVDDHWGQISIQITRLKMLKENLIPRVITESQNDVQMNKTQQQQQRTQQMEAFEIFSPIPMVNKECYNETAVLEHKTIPVEAKGDVSMVSGRTDSMMPRKIQYYDDSISRVSMGDISTWYCDETNLEKMIKSKPTTSSSGKPNSNSPNGGVGGSLEDKFNADLECVASSNNKMKELNADLDSVLDRLQSILANNFTLDDTADNTQLKETANEMEGLLGTLIRGVEQRRTVRGGDKI